MNYCVVNLHMDTLYKVRVHYSTFWPSSEHCQGVPALAVPVEWESLQCYLIFLKAFRDFGCISKAFF